jgi:hypothetical protein
VGALTGYGLQYWSRRCRTRSTSAAGRHSWVSFIPVTFELTILFAALAAVVGMLALNGLPMPYHPVFNAPRFALASRDRFFLCHRGGDPKFDLDQTRAPHRASAGGGGS